MIVDRLNEIKNLVKVMKKIKKPESAQNETLSDTNSTSTDTDSEKSGNKNNTESEKRGEDL